MSNEMTELEEMRELQKPKTKSVKGLFSTAGKLDWVQVFLGGILVVLLAVFSIAFFWLVIDDNPPMEIFETYPVNNSGFPGDSVTYHLDLCINTSAQPERSISWEDSIAYAVPGSDLLPANLNCVNGNAMTIIPETLPPATDYFIRLTWTFPINPIRTRTMDEKIGPFIVLDPFLEREQTE